MIKTCSVQQIWSRRLFCECIFSSLIFTKLVLTNFHMFGHLTNTDVAKKMLNLKASIILF